jgi:hypothetical protein
MNIHYNIDLFLSIVFHIKCVIKNALEIEFLKISINLKILKLNIGKLNKINFKLLFKI